MDKVNSSVTDEHNVFAHTLHIHAADYGEVLNKRKACGGPVEAN